MKPIPKEYLVLFNAITDAEETLGQLRIRLMEVQQQAEELFLDEDSPASQFSG